jgi:hypothetical protein
MLFYVKVMLHMKSFLFLVVVVLCMLLVLSKKHVEHYVGNLRVADDLDNKRAVKQALKKICNEKGYTWRELPGGEFVYDCKHTKETCLNESVYPTPDDVVPRYYEWRDKDSEDAKEAAQLESTTPLLSAQMGASSDYRRGEDVRATEGVCVMGNEGFRKFCENEKLRYDSSTGKCFTTLEYCRPKLLAFCNGDCFEPPSGMILSKIFGTTLGRSLGQASWIDQTVMAACAK